MKLVALLGVLAILASSWAKTGFGPGEQDWGYVTVRNGAHMFWWLHETLADVPSSTERPLLIWLQGGPGGSSTGYGNFEILGPWDLELNLREHAWVKDFNVLLVDNPVGTGYSYVENSSLYAKDNQQVASDFIALLQGFYGQRPEFSSTPVYIFGQSYGGKMAIEITLEVWRAQQAGTLKSNISGVAMGNSWLSPVESTLSWGPFLYQVSLLDRAGLAAVNAEADYTKVLFDRGDYYASTVQWARTENVILDKTDGVDFYNILTKRQRNSFNIFRSVQESAFDRQTYSKYYSKAAWDLDALMNGPVKTALNIPSTVRWGSQSNNVFNAMYVDFMKPVISVIEEVLNTTPVPVYVYNGNVDLICNTPGQMMWEERLAWTRSAEYRSAKRTTIWVNNTVEGYKQVGGGFGFYSVNVAGHSAPLDNPAALRDLQKLMTSV